MLLSSKNLIVFFSVVLLITALTDAKPADDNGCDLEGTIRDYARNVFGNTNERLQKAWNWLKRKTHEGVTAARRGLQNLEHQMADPAENELTP